MLDPLVVAIVRSPERVRRGDTARVRFVTTEPGTAQLQVRRDGAVVDTVTKEVEAGLRHLTWTATGPVGRVSLVLRFEDEAGRVARDRVGLRVLPRG